MRRSRAILLAATLLVVTVPPVASQAAARHCTKPMAGGDWPMYGRDLAGTQRQDSERTIGSRNVGTLVPTWKTGDTGYSSPPPIVSGGCVFINTGGHIEAFNLRTREPVWRATGADTSHTFAGTVVNGRVHVGLYNGGRPRAAAFDVTDGHLLWV